MLVICVSQKFPKCPKGTCVQKYTCNAPLSALWSWCHCGLFGTTWIFCKSMTPKRWPKTVLMSLAFSAFVFASSSCCCAPIQLQYPSEPADFCQTMGQHDGLCRHDWLYATQSPSMQHQLHLAVSSLDASATSESFSTTGTWAKIPANKCKLNWSSTLKVYRFGQSSKLHAAHSQQCEQNQQKPRDMEHLHKVSDKKLAQDLRIWIQIHIWTPHAHSCCAPGWLPWGIPQ